MIRYLQVILTKCGIPTTITRFGLKWYCPSFEEMWRAETLYEKEPETIAWINTMPVGSVLWDIGANVGTYSLYALSRGIRVVCFEPDNRVNAILEKNLELNHMIAPVHKIALGEDIDYSLVPQPQYIKIDTDGFEIPILKGLDPVLITVRELSVELDPPSRTNIISILENYGYSIVSESRSAMMDNTQYAPFTNAIFRKTIG